MLWPRTGSLMKTQTRILGKQIILCNKDSYIEKVISLVLFRITPVLFGWQRNLSVLKQMRRVHYGDMGKAPTKPLPQAFYFVNVLLLFFGSIINGSMNFLFLPDRRFSDIDWGRSKSNMSKIVSIDSSSVCGTSLESFKRRFCNWFWCLLCVYLGPSTMYTISPILF